MEFKSEYELGQKVYCCFFESNWKEITCDVCEGVRTITLKNNKVFDCPNCDGRGRLSKRVNYLVIESTILQIRFIEAKNKKGYKEELTICRNRCRDCKMEINEDDIKNIFLTEHEADQRCEYLNSNY